MPNLVVMHDGQSGANNDWRGWKFILAKSHERGRRSSWSRAHPEYSRRPISPGSRRIDAARVDALIEVGPKAMRLFTSKTAVQFGMPPVFPDYHAAVPPGAKSGFSYGLDRQQTA